MNKDKVKTCWACKRVITEKGKLGLCPECANRYGTAASAAIVFAGGLAWKNRKTILKGVARIIKK